MDSRYLVTVVCVIIGNLIGTILYGLYKDFKKRNDKMSQTLQIMKMGEQIADLEKETTRLKTNERTLLIERKIVVKENVKAKAIIEEETRLLKNIVWLYHINDEHTSGVIEQAESFLKE